MIEYELHERIGKGGMGDVYVGAEIQPNGTSVRPGSNCPPT